MSTALRPMMQEFDTLRERLERFFQEGGLTSDGTTFLALDVQETDDALVVTASVPGIKAEDLKIEVHNGVLTIQGQTREEREEQEGTWHRRERRFGHIYRSVTLPTSVDEVRAEATLEDGILKLKLPKNGEENKHRIAVRTA